MHSQSSSGQEEVDFNWCDKILTLAKKNKLKVQFSYVVTQKSIANGELEKVINYCFNRRVLTICNLPIPLGSWENYPQMVLSKRLARFIRTLERKTPYLRTDHLNNLRQSGCPAFKEKLYITPYGDVLGCTFLPFSIGNLKKEPLEKILDRRQALSYFMKYQPLCPPAEDKRIINALLAALKGRKKYPIDLKDIQKLLPRE